MTQYSNIRRILKGIRNRGRRPIYRVFFFAKHVLANPFKGTPRPNQETLSDSPHERFSRGWFESLYKELGDGIPCYRPPNSSGYNGGPLKTCNQCCPPGAILNLLPNEEEMFRDSIDGWNFQLRDHTSVKGLKALACYKRGLCGGHKPFICRTHPFYFENSHLMFQKSWCRLSVERYMALHSHAVMRLQSIVEKFGLRDTSLGHDQRDYVFAEQHKMPPPD